jgi:hypothetical protein
MSVEGITTRPGPEDVLFDSVSADEREACLIYELSRESPSLRRVFENGWHTTPPRDLPDEAPPFLGSGQTKEDYAAVLRKASRSKGDLTDQDPETPAHIHWLLFMQDWRPLLAWNPFDDWVDEKGANVGDPPTTKPYFLSTPYQKLPKSRRTKLPAAPLIRREPLNAWSTAERGLTVTTYDGAYFTFFIRFRGHTDKELAEAFEKLAGEIRPEKFKIEKRRPSGKRAPERRAAFWLRRLGACRLCAHYPNLQSVPQEFRNVWYRNPMLMRTSCISLNVFFRERFQFLDGGEKPVCLAECERKGRFRDKSGRPQKS